MLRTRLFGLCLAVSSLLIAGAARADFTIVSNPSTISSPGGSFDFNFNGQQNGVLPQHNLIGIRVDYKFNMPTIPGQSSMDLVSNLLIPGVDGTDYKLGFDINANLADSSTTSFSDRGTTSPSGFIFSEVIKGYLVPGGHITGVLQASGVALENLSKYFGFFPPESGTPEGFAPGTIEAFMTLRFTGERGDNVPEPASMLIWGALTGAGVVMRRRFGAAKTA